MGAGFHSGYSSADGGVDIGADSTLRLPDFLAEVYIITNLFVEDKSHGKVDDAFLSGSATAEMQTDKTNLVGYHSV